MDNKCNGIVISGDSEIHYEIIGEGVPVLMLHGWSVDRDLMKGCLEPIFSRTSGKYRRIYLDLPGMGQSKAGDSVRNADHMLDAILAFVDQVIPGEHLLLAGESFGCFLARGFLRLRSEWIDGLLLICPCVIPGAIPRDVPLLRVLRFEKDYFDTIRDEEKNGFLSFHAVQTHDVYTRYKTDIEPAFSRYDRDFLDNRLDGSFSYPLEDLPVPFDKPALILSGRQDHMVGYKNPFRLTEDYTRATFVALDMAGHNLQIEQKDLFEVLVQDWLQRLSEETV